jgi:hypothetical protein
MADIRDFRESAIRKDGEKNPATRHSPKAQSYAEGGRYCAYNQTRERFISTDVEAADFSNASLEDRLSAFKSGSGAALWITPFRGLSPTSVRFPIDLVYLNQNCVVLDAVESFPISTVGASIPTAASVLALPARVISEVGILAGDQLILSAPEEMKRHLRQLQSSSADIQAHPHLVHGPSTPFQVNLPSQEATGHVIQFEDRSQSEASLEYASAEASAPQKSVPQPQPSEPNPEPPASKEVKKPKNWWQRLLSDEPPDPRKAQREPLFGLVAYFFTGGVPVAHGVRNISVTGIYVLTDERWYIGTVVRITLTDQREPTIERSITLNAKVIRWGNDGVGLQFILQSQKGRLRGGPAAQPDLADGASTKQLEQFIQRFRAQL